VDLTAEVLAGLFGMPMADAARSYGVSPTTMKRACRRLGIGRWPYSRAGKAKVAVSASFASFASVVSVPGVGIGSEGAGVEGTGFEGTGFEGDELWCSAEGDGVWSSADGDGLWFLPSA
jgi:hypothetical protein